MGLLRLFLALSVVVGHSAPLFGLQLMPNFVAVRLFFIISGFYMSLVLSGKYRGNDGVSTFYVNRFLRLYPAYVFAIILTFAAYWFAPIGGREQSLLVSDIRAAVMHAPPILTLTELFLLLIPNIAIFGSDVAFFLHRASNGWLFGIQPMAHSTVRASAFLLIPSAWSIGVELWFYLLVPAFARLESRIIVPILVVSLMLFFGMEAFYPWSTYFFFPASLWLFMVGMLAHRLWALSYFRQSMNKRAIWIVAASGLAALVLREFIPLYRNYPGLAYATLAVALPFIFEVFKAVPWDRWIGNLSYPVYLFHTMVLVILENHFGLTSAALAIVATLTISVLVNLTIEEPLERYRQRRVARRAAHAHPQGFERGTHGPQ